MKLITGTGKGFFALTNDTARRISECLKNEEKWYIKWGPETLYYDSTYGQNVWEYYFKQPHELNSPYTEVSDYTELVFLKSSFRQTMNYIYSNFIKLNEKTEKHISSNYEVFLDNKILGVHIRRTDKFLIGMHGTTLRHTPVDLDLFALEIDKIVDDYDYIYLASDCEEACLYMKQRYNKKLLYNLNGIRGRGTTSIHNNFSNISGYIKGLNVLADMVLLSKCSHLIRSSSNVSVTSLYLNLNLTQLNLNEKYLNDSEADIL
jgi:hypothetical protein